LSGAALAEADYLMAANLESAKLTPLALALA
jgi:hypothetical protein